MNTINLSATQTNKPPLNRSDLLDKFKVELRKLEKEAFQEIKAVKMNLS